MSRQEEKLKRKFGLHLKELRNRKGLSLRNLEATSGIDFSTINKIENGIRNPSLTVLFSLAEGLDINIAELVTFPE
jgi:transcriptional regulator with XRE-family HTH domain